MGKRRGFEEPPTRGNHVASLAGWKDRLLNQCAIAGETHGTSGPLLAAAGLVPASPQTGVESEVEIEA
jgi:hypothetical protein